MRSRVPRNIFSDSSIASQRSSSGVRFQRPHLVQITHSTMGAFAGLMVTARWLELRMLGRTRRLAGAAASAAMLAIALILLFYREANIVLPPE